MVNNVAAVTASSGGGGAVYLSGGVTSMSNNSFIGNSAGGYGGALAYTHQCFNFSSVPGIPGAQTLVAMIQACVVTEVCRCSKCGSEPCRHTSVQMYSTDSIAAAYALSV